MAAARFALFGAGSSFIKPAVDPDACQNSTCQHELSNKTTYITSANANS
jgi:hypothetical protein